MTGKKFTSLLLLNKPLHLPVSNQNMKVG